MQKLECQCLQDSARIWQKMTNYRKIRMMSPIKIERLKTNYLSLICIIPRSYTFHTSYMVSNRNRIKNEPVGRQIQNLQYFLFSLRN